jgi:hypothetical protein
MLTKTKQAEIYNAWSRLEKVCEQDTTLDMWVQKALDVCKREERSHRSTWGAHGYTVSVETTCKALVLRHVLTAHRNPRSWEEAAEIRTDMLYARGIRARLLRLGLLDQLNDYGWIATFDYLSTMKKKV